MSCTNAACATELEFVQALTTRGIEGPCRGPVLTLVLKAHRMIELEHILASDMATDLLWGGHLGESRSGFRFALCAAHWLDLCALTWLRSQQYGRKDWHAESDHLLRDLCDAAGWDRKEIVNMFSWQQTELT